MPPRRSSLKKSLRAIERAFADIERLLERLSARAREARRGVGRAPRARITLSPQRRAQLKLQGAYMGYMRQLKAAQKARVKALKEKRGFQAAIRLAKRISRG